MFSNPEVPAPEIKETRLSRNPFIAIALLIGIAIAILGLAVNISPAFLLLDLALGIYAIILMIRGVRIWYRYRDPRQPLPPRLRKAKLPTLPPRPPEMIPPALG